MASFDGGLVLEKVSDFISEKRKALFAEETAVRDAVRAYYFEQREYEDEVRECYVVSPDDLIEWRFIKSLTPKIEVVAT